MKVRKFRKGDEKGVKARVKSTLRKAGNQEDRVPFLRSASSG